VGGKKREENEDLTAGKENQGERGGGYKDDARRLNQKEKTCMDERRLSAENSFTWRGKKEGPKLHKGK